MMVSLASVMLLMMAYVTLFADVGGRIGDARSMIELTNRMRSASNRLRMDLEAHTCDMLTWQRPEAGGGYFEIIEGPLRDYRTSDDAATLVDERTYPIGDTDDVLMFTVRSKEGPFTGKYWNDANNNGTVDSGEVQTVQSEVAEVVWFLRPTLKNSNTLADPATFTLYRRVFLVLPTYQGNPTVFNTAAQTSWPRIPPAFIENCDISVHAGGTSGTTIVPNTLADLTKRECRFNHKSDTSAAFLFPHQFDRRYMLPIGGNETAGGVYTIDASKPHYGEDVVLTNVIGFDVQVYDPAAPIKSKDGIAVLPDDPGYNLTGPNAPTLTGSLGAWTDLNWGSPASPTPWAGGGATDPFKTQGHTKSQLNATAGGDATYDTWSYHYEHDGINQVNPAATTHDEGTDGFDNNGDGVVDDPDERETSPPYPVPLRGIKIKIRCYEPDSRQVHQVDVVESFLPQ